MTHMVEKQVFIAPEQAKRMKKLSNTLGVSEGELIHKAISSYLGSSQDGGRHETKRLPDRRGWLKELEFMKSRIERPDCCGRISSSDHTRGNVRRNPGRAGSYEIMPLVDTVNNGRCGPGRNQGIDTVPTLILGRSDLGGGQVERRGDDSERRLQSRPSDRRRSRGQSILERRTAVATSASIRKGGRPMVAPPCRSEPSADC